MFKIAEDEALNSFYARNLFFAGHSSFRRKSHYSFVESDIWNMEKLLSLMRKMSIERVVSIHRLVFNHTTFHRSSFAFSENYLDRCCLSAKLTAEKIRGYVGSRFIKFCPKCVIDDIQSKGYVYWRRTHQDDVKVCWRHNTILQCSCGICGQNYVLEDNYFGGAWEQCECGGTIQDLKSEKNFQIEDLKVAVFLAEFYSYDYRVSYFDLNRVISSRLNSIHVQSFEDFYGYIGKSAGDFYAASMGGLQKNYGLSDFIIKNIYLLAFVFQTFSDFVMALTELKVERHKIDYDPSIEYVADRLNYVDRRKKSNYK